MIPSSQNVGEHVSHAGAAVVPAWKKELNERLAANRSRRSRHAAEQVALPGLEHISQKVESRASRLAAKVAQRYANAPSYSELLAAPVSVREAVDVSAEDLAIQAPPANPLPVAWSGPLTSAEVSQVLASAAVEQDEPVQGFIRPDSAAEDEPSVDTVEPLEVNLIEFPRELVAARKVRPRLAEGPLSATEEQTQHDGSQFKIFEVAPEVVSQRVSIGAAAAAWSGIRLDVDSSPSIPAVGTAMPFKTAGLEDRLMAGIFDVSLIVAAFAIFILVFVACTAHPPTGKPAWLAAGLVLTGFAALYQYLFFTYADATPGMRYAKIALCTFDDENPTRKAMCRRVWFAMLSAAPLGLGFLWACFDPERLSWHDRLSRMYQRSYS